MMKVSFLECTRESQDISRNSAATASPLRINLRTAKSLPRVSLRDSELSFTSWEVAFALFKRGWV